MKPVTLKKSNTMAPDEDEVTKAHCPQCGAVRSAYVRGSHVVSFPDEGDGTSASDTGMILECCGCGHMYFRKDRWFSEWETIGEHPVTGQLRIEGGVETTYWPSPAARLRPKWLDKIEQSEPDFGSLIHEMYTALDNDLRVVSAIAARTVFDCASELLGIDSMLRFQDKLNRLRTSGKISTEEEGALQVLVNAGNAAAHGAWRPSREQLKTMMEVLESFLHRSFIVGDGIAKLKAAVPPKPRREKPQGSASS